MEELELYEELLLLKRSGQGGVLVTVIDSEGSVPRKAGAKMLVRADGTTVGTVGGGAVEQRALEEAPRVAAAGQPITLAMELTEEHGLTCGGRVRLYFEPLAQVPQLLVVGKGHIARALEQLGPGVGFAITLLDPPSADGTGLEQELKHLLPGRRASVVVACPTHHQDFLAARLAIEVGAPFVGVVGSRRKRKNMDAYLVDHGCDAEAVAAVASPVGLDIGAETPAEIALSILAQLIQRERQQ